MNERNDRRGAPREIFQPSEFGIVHLKFKNSRSDKGRKEEETLVVNMLDLSDRGVLLQSPFRFRRLSSLEMLIRDPRKKLWRPVKGKVKWLKDHTSRPGFYKFGVEFYKHQPVQDLPPQIAKSRRKGLLPSDIEFLFNTNLFAAIPRESVCPMLNSLSYKRFRAGERFIRQGDEGDRFYIIRSGSCIVHLEKDSILYPFARLKEGDIVGEMSVLTGEKRSTHVDAETDMEVWGLSREQFDLLSDAYPDLRIFLTEVITNRISESKLTASRTVGRYIINEIIGQGGWSIVYKGVHGKLNLPVAIKMLKHNLAMDKDFIDKFQNEARTIARLNHPNIVHVFDIEELYRTVFIIMEHLAGVSLEYVLTRMPRLSLKAILDIILQICSGLAYAHKEGIIHQDIKPANIFIQPDNRIKIVDFGLSCPPGNIDFELPGTVFYMSPEQISGDPVDERSDIYSLGITVYEMVTGKRPFPEDDLSRLMEFHLHEDVHDPRAVVPDLPDELVNLIMNTVRKDPAMRYESISRIVSDLQPLTERLGIDRQTVNPGQGKMMGLFLFYQDEHQFLLNQLIDEFNSNISELGATLRISQVDSP
jgi:CRP-like cAMP-binding protein